MLANGYIDACCEVIEPSKTRSDSLFTDFYEAHGWLEDHPIFKDPEYKMGHFLQGLYVMVVKVNPENETIEEDRSLNTAVRVWLEHGPYTVTTKEEAGVEWGGCSHDIDLDCGAPTFEEAIIELANLVEKHYGTYDPEVEAEKDWADFVKRTGWVENDDVLTNLNRPRPNVEQFKGE